MAIGFNCCCVAPNVTLHALGCNSLDLAGATVAFTRTGFATVTGTTDSTGRFAAALANGSWNWSVASPRFTTKTGSVTASGTAQSVTTAPTVLSTYVCVGNCAQPVARTLFLTNDSGTFTLTYDSLSGGWVGTWNWTSASGIVLNGGSCGAGTAAIRILFSMPALSYTANATAAACGGNQGMWDTGHTGTTHAAAFASGSATPACPPAFAWSIPNASWSEADSGVISAAWAGAAPTIGTTTISE